MELNVNSNYTISQDVTTTPGATYEVTFQLKRNSECGRSCNGFVGLIEKTSTGTPTAKTINPKKPFSLPRNSQGWVSQSFRFTATSTQSSLQIESSTRGNCGPVIDDVKMFLV